MSHSYNKIYIHGVIVTKNRVPYICEKIELIIFKQIVEIFKSKCECSVLKINGMPDHVHILFELNPNMSIAQIFNFVKGGSSFWINKNINLDYKFIWQDGYSTFSVSEENLEKVKKYIEEQKKHHSVQQ